MIDHLTSDQEKLLDSRIDHWLSLDRSTEPLDRAAATEAICGLFRAIGKKRPAVLIFSSPRMCLLAWRELRTRAPQGWFQKLRRGWVGFVLTCIVDAIACAVLDKLDVAVNGPASTRLHAWITRTAENQLRALSARLDWQLRDRLEAQLDGDIWKRVGRWIADRVWRASAEPGLIRRLERHIDDRFGSLDLDAQLSDPLMDQLREQLAAQLGDSRRTVSLRASDHFLLPTCVMWNTSVRILHDYCSRIGAYAPKQKALLQLWLLQHEHCHWWFAGERFALASDRPRVLSFDAAGRLHAESGPAVEYSDGYSLYAWHGVRVEPRLIIDPGSITVPDIERERNAEIRLVMIERYGWTRYISSCGARVIDQVPEDHPLTGLRGARLLVKELDGLPEPIVYLELVNSTPDPGGTYKHYLERIDPKVYDGDAGRSCHAAMASRWHHRDDEGRLVRTFSHWQDYQPTAES